MKKKFKGRFMSRSKRQCRTIFRIEKVIKRKGDKSLVKWVSYSDAFNSWVDNKEIVGKL